MHMGSLFKHSQDKNSLLHPAFQAYLKDNNLDLDKIELSVLGPQNVFDHNIAELDSFKKQKLFIAFEAQSILNMKNIESLQDDLKYPVSKKKEFVYTAFLEANQALLKIAENTKN